MRHIFHILVSALMWCLFGWYWYLVVQRQINFASVKSIGLLVVISAVGFAATVLWVAHNRRLARRNRRQARPAAAPETYLKDHLGRLRVGPELAVLCQAKVVRISLDAEGRKVGVPAQGVTD